MLREDSFLWCGVVQEYNLLISLREPKSCPSLLKQQQDFSGRQDLSGSLTQVWSTGEWNIVVWKRYLEARISFPSEYDCIYTNADKH